MAEKRTTEIEIVSDGYPGGTKVRLADGTDIGHVVSGVSWEHRRVDDIPRVTLKLLLQPVTLRGVLVGLETMDHRMLKRVEFADGTVLEATDPGAALIAALDVV